MQNKTVVEGSLKSMKAAIINLGCKVNKYESDAMAKKLQSAGMMVVDPDTFADIYIVNTCSVTNMAQRKSRQMLRRVKKINPNAIVIAVGCYVNAEHDTLINEDFIDVLVGNNRKNEIVQVIEEYLAEIANNDYYLDINKTNEYEEMGCLDVAAMNHQRAYIKIQDGCNQFCSYCIIPYTRGRVRSRKPEHIISEIRKLAQDGIKEFVLTGIHISSYGVDLCDEKSEYDEVIEIGKVDCERTQDKDMVIKNLGDLIFVIEQMPEVKRIRLGSLEPRIITRDFLLKVGSSDKLCPHFHLSLQSACNDTLKRMNRKYTIEEFMEKCELLRKYFDKPAITTDVIVGFPGETEEEFQVTVSNLEQLNLYELHVFKYSIRSGTVAAKMPNQIQENIKNMRSDVLLEMTSKQKLEFEAELKGFEEEVLVEEAVGPDLYTGYSKRYVKVEISSKDDIVNQIVKISL